MRAVGGTTTGAHLWKRLDRVGLQNHNTLYLRYYIKLSKNGTHHHTGGGLGGVTHNYNWPMGTAGIRPSGDDNFSTRLEVHGSGTVSNGQSVNNTDVIDFYTYWMGMHHNATLPEYYGNKFVGDINLRYTREKWTCVEYMVKLNTPVTASNGELKLWIDGELVAYLGQGFPSGKWLHETFLPLGSSGYDYNQNKFSYSMNQVQIVPFDGFRWRKTNDLKLNIMSIQYYVTKDPAGFEGKIRYDNVVLATEYIGPISN
jgi:hypothetical protein